MEGIIVEALIKMSKSYSLAPMKLHVQLHVKEELKVQAELRSLINYDPKIGRLSWIIWEGQIKSQGFLNGEEGSRGEPNRWQCERGFA